MLTLGHIDWTRCPGCAHYDDNPGDQPPCSLAGSADWQMDLEVCADGAVACHSYREKEGT